MRSVLLADETMQPIRRRLIEIKSLHVMYYRPFDRSVSGIKIYSLYWFLQNYWVVRTAVSSEISRIIVSTNYGGTGKSRKSRWLIPTYSSNKPLLGSFKWRWIIVFAKLVKMFILVRAIVDLFRFLTMASSVTNQS